MEKLSITAAAVCWSGKCIKWIFECECMSFFPITRWLLLIIRISINLKIEELYSPPPPIIRTAESCCWCPVSWVLIYPPITGQHCPRRRPIASRRHRMKQLLRQSGPGPRLPTALYGDVGTSVSFIKWFHTHKLHQLPSWRSLSEIMPRCWDCWNS